MRQLLVHHIAVFDRVRLHHHSLLRDLRAKNHRIGTHTPHTLDGWRKRACIPTVLIKMTPRHLLAGPLVLKPRVHSGGRARRCTLLQKTSLPMISRTVDLPAAMPPPSSRHTGRRVLGPLTLCICASQLFFRSAKISYVVRSLGVGSRVCVCRVWGFEIARVVSSLRGGGCFPQHGDVSSAHVDKPSASGYMCCWQQSGPAHPCSKAGLNPKP